MSEQVSQSFDAVTATNALAGNCFYGDNNITFNGDNGEQCPTEKRHLTGLIDGRFSPRGSKKA